MDVARDDGRRSPLAEADDETPGAAFLTARGFRIVLTLLHARLPLNPPDVAPAQAAATCEQPGYHVVTWRGRVPDQRAESFAASGRAMDDLPSGESDLGRQVWDVDRVRAAADAPRGEHLHTVAAVAGNEMVGFVEVIVPAEGNGDGLHYGTGVPPEHRSRGLAR